MNEGLTVQRFNQHFRHAMASIPRAWLETDNGERIPLVGTCSIGRDPQNMLEVGGGKVSRRHALIHSQNQSEFWLVDLGSRNGTFRNSRPIKQPTQLRHGDTIEIGSTQFKLHIRRPRADGASTSPSALEETLVTQRSSDVWLLVTDVENFTVMSQALPAEELSRCLGSWLLECTDLVETTGGCVDKYVGDGFLAYWENKKAARESFASTLNKFRTLQDKAALSFRWTLHYANIQLGISRFGNDSLVGKEINFAYRMEKIAGALRLPRLLSKPAADSLAKALRPRTVGVHLVKGFEGNFEFFTI